MPTRLSRSSKASCGAWRGVPVRTANPSSSRRRISRRRSPNPGGRQHSKAPDESRTVLMETPTFGVLIAFSAGLLSFLSPCVLPLIPSYVTFITGLSLEEVQKTRRLALVHSLLFILGFTLIFLALGATATVLGRVLLVYREWISRVGGVLVIVR